ncbi:MAG: hypothetical protein IKZ49_03015 [Alphaproteobacteria bacterium]|nr:hypothetical protein [Alphaproteobacteria bacterium]
MRNVKKQSNFLPESISVMLRSLLTRIFGIFLCFISLWFIFGLFFYDPYLTGFEAVGSFGNQGIVGYIVGFVKYMVGFIPTLFLLLCMGRFGLSLFVKWEEERAPEYNFLRGFIALCVGSAGLGLINTNGTFGGMAGAIVAADFGPVLGLLSLPMGILLFVSFLLLSGILLHIK